MTIYYLSKIQNLTSLFYLINVFNCIQCIQENFITKKLNLLTTKTFFEIIYSFWNIIDYLKNDVNFENSQLSIFEIINSKYKTNISNIIIRLI